MQYGNRIKRSYIAGGQISVFGNVKAVQPTPNHTRGKTGVRIKETGEFPRGTGS